jgi:hypothetical protein
MVPAALNDGAPVHGEPPLALHFGGMYLDVTLLLLHLRVSVLRFSQRMHFVTRESVQKTERREEIKRWREEFHKIRWQFLLLENLYQYPHLSNQQQHLEMYDLQRECMDVRLLYEEIDKEVRTSDEFLNNELDQERNDLASNLNVVAVLGLAAALALGWMDAHSETQSGLWYASALFATFFVLLLLPILFSRHLGSTFSWFSSLRGYRWASVIAVVMILCGGLVWGLPRVERFNDLFTSNAPQPPCPSPPGTNP